MFGAAPAAARRDPPVNPLATYVGARAASLNGDPARSAQLYALLADLEPGNVRLARRAVSQAISAGDFPLALRLSEKMAKSGDLSLDARLLLIAERLRRKRVDQALGLAGDAPGQLNGDAAPASELAFLSPFLRAWDAARRKSPRALDHLATVSPGSPVQPYAAQHRASILLRLGRREEALAVAQQAMAALGGRSPRVRLALATAFFDAGDRRSALAMLDGRDVTMTSARGRVLSGKRPGDAVRTPAEAFADLLGAMSIDLNQRDSRSMPIALARIASHAAPRSANAALLVGALLEADGRTDAALQALSSVPADSPLASEARDGIVRTLVRAGRKREALDLAWRAATARGATADDHSRLGDTLAELDRHGEAADAFARALKLIEAGGPGGEPWTLYLLRGSALLDAGRWPEARESLRQAHRLAPREPLVLNYLGYSMLERGEDLDTAEKLVTEASRLAPNNASITDSLGWALYKRGKIDEALSVLQKAAQAEPAVAEIREHLGDVLFSAGRRFEARFAWEAALATAEDVAVAQRLRTKLQSGLTPATAAP